MLNEIGFVTTKVYIACRIICANSCVPNDYFVHSYSFTLHGRLSYDYLFENHSMTIILRLSRCLSTKQLKINK